MAPEVSKAKLQQQIGAQAQGTGEAQEHRGNCSCQEGESQQGRTEMVEEEGDGLEKLPGNRAERSRQLVVELQACGLGDDKDDAGAEDVVVEEGGKEGEGGGEGGGEEEEKGRDEQAEQRVEEKGEEGSGDAQVVEVREISIGEGGGGRGEGITG